MIQRGGHLVSKIKSWVNSRLNLLACRQLHIAPNNDYSAQFVVYYAKEGYSTYKHDCLILTPSWTKNNILQLTFSRRDGGGYTAAWKLSIDENGFVKGTYYDDPSTPVLPEK